ncbi:MAG: hypothetical protein KDB69_01605 [Acidimicrobiia bacterium]|nr:hypothetical protein [Acidimicrobiia bacterium]
MADPTAMRPRRRWSSSVLAALALITLVGLAGCSTDSTPVSAFAARATDVTAAYVEESQAIGYTYQRSIELEVGQIVDEGAESAVERATELVRSETVAYLAVLADAVTRYSEAFEALPVPAAVQQERDDYVAVVELARESIPSMREAVADAASIPMIRLALASSTYADSAEAWTAACRSLEQAVRDEGHGIDLKCERPDVSEVTP